MQGWEAGVFICFKENLPSPIPGARAHLEYIPFADSNLGLMWTGGVGLWVVLALALMWDKSAYPRALWTDILKCYLNLFLNKQYIYMVPSLKGTVES